MASRLRSGLNWQQAASRLVSPIFDAIREPLRQVATAIDLPDPARLNQCATGIKNFRGIPIRFVAADGLPAALHYETRIAETGEIATRANWHDFFNAMAWLAFHDTKSAISETHARVLADAGAPELLRRSTARDVLTLFDEGGMMVACDDDALLDLIRNFQWKALFVDRRAEVVKHMRFYLFGHSMLEKALAPYVGVTAKALLFKVDADFLSATPAAQVTVIDGLAARWLMNEANLGAAENFSPLPWLGIPGWWQANASPSFYDNQQYFRPGRKVGR